jgi:photosystem II stability/assembly factor-like uncharacterized protein
MGVRRSALGIALASGAFVLAACGGSDAPTLSEDEPAEEAPQTHGGGEAGMQHIHGLGVRGDTLFIATHGGLWMARPGQTKPQRVGESGQDIMGFSVVSNDRFIGSGHPHPSQTDLPPNLGLIESRDGGKTWKNVSLLGEADFHVLESSGPRVYGFDGTQGRLMVSPDGGRSWKQRTLPAGLFSLAIDPTSPDTFVASTELGLVVSANAGRTMRPLQLREQRAGLLAWPTKNDLYLLDGRGDVQLSSDGGRRWQRVGSIEGQPAAFIADGRDLYAALADGTVKRSTDGGRSWTVSATP